MKYNLHLVPNATPNAEGRWITVTTERKVPPRFWTDIADFFKPHIPEGEHLVGYNTDPA